MNYDKIFITSSNSFYKNKLFSAIACYSHICVIYTGANYSERNADFYCGEMLFEHTFLPHNFIKQFFTILSFLKKNSAKEIVYNGWDNKITWLAIFLISKRRNSCIIESSINDSDVSGLKGYIKKFFLSRIHKTYASGILQTELLNALNFKGEIIKYGGCGILNYLPQPEFSQRKEVKNFLFVGRLAPEKNIQLLISVFNNRPDLHLTIIGFGPLEQDLKSLARENISFTGAIKNADLSQYYRNADVFILPSKREPWGLVVEEALNNGTPVIVSDNVGCYKDLINENTGLVFASNDMNSLQNAINKICNSHFYNQLRLEISKLDFKKREKHQISSFL